MLNYVPNGPPFNYVPNGPPVAPRHPPRRARNPFPDLFSKHALRGASAWTHGYRWRDANAGGRLRRRSASYAARDNGFPANLSSTRMGALSGVISAVSGMITVCSNANWPDMTA